MKKVIRIIGPILSLIIVITGVTRFIIYLASPLHPNLTREERIPIRGVFLHRAGEYSVLLDQEDGIVNYTVNGFAEWWGKQHGFTRGDNGCKITSLKLIADVQPEDKEFLLLSGKGATISIEIHIRDPRSIGGGGWLTNDKNPVPHQTIPIR